MDSNFIKDIWYTGGPQVPPDYGKSDSDDFVPSSFSFDFCEDALSHFCSENDVAFQELETLLSFPESKSSQYSLPPGSVVMAEGVGMISRLYKGLPMTYVVDYTIAPKYFFVHESCCGGFFKVFELAGQDYYVPCVDVRSGRPVTIIEQGGFTNIKKYDSKIYICSKGLPSTSVPLVHKISPTFRVKIPFRTDVCATDLGWGDAFAFGLVDDHKEARFELEGLSINFPFLCPGDWAIISFCSETCRWCYLDCISPRRVLNNSQALTACGYRAKGYPVTYSISDCFSVQRDLAGFLNRVKLTDTKSVVYPDNFGEELRRKLNKIFVKSSFVFRDVFGSKYVVPLVEMSSEHHLQRIESSFGEVEAFFSLEKRGIVTVPDVIRGKVFEPHDNIIVSLQDFLPDWVYKVMDRDNPDLDYVDSWPLFLARFSDQLHDEIFVDMKLKLRDSRVNELSDHECFNLFFVLLKVEVFYNGTVLILRSDSSSFNALSFGRPLILAFCGTLIYLFVRPYSSFQKFTNSNKASLRSESGVVFHDVQADSIECMFDFRFHVLWTKRADFQFVDSGGFKFSDTSV